MTPEFLSIKDAAKYTTQSQPTIRRLVKSLLLENPDTPHVQQEQLRNGSLKYYVSSTYLKSRFMEGENAHVAGSKPPIHDNQALVEMIRILEHQLETKERTIEDLRAEKNALLGIRVQNHLIEAPAAHKPRRFFWQRRDRHVTP